GIQTQWEQFVVIFKQIILMTERYTLLLGDNRLTCPVDVADRCNFGLIPSSELN
ncbi:unnamed protein product, partial [Rotaria magnacalcarata]